MATAVAPPVTAKTTTSTDPLYAAAVAQAKTALAGETTPIQNEQAASDASFKQKQTDATNAAAAVSSLLKPIGPAVNGEYQTAAQNQELAASGFSHGMEDALQGNTDNLNAMLQKLGSPATLDSHASEAADGVYAAGGFNPGTTFSKQGAAFGAAADLQSGDALLKGQQDVSSLRAQSIIADQGFQAKIAEMAGKLPGDIQTNYQHLQTLALNDAKFRETVAKDKSDAAIKLAGVKLAQLKYSTGVQEFNAKQQLAYTKLSNQEFNQNRDYAIKLANLGIAQTKVQLAVTKASIAAANGGLTPAALNKYTSVAQSIAMKSYYGYTKVTSKSGIPTSTPNVGNVTYAEALQNILQKGTPVQVALDALDRVYPTDQRPTDDVLAKVLGPLDPQALKTVAAGMKAQNAAIANIWDPAASLIAGGGKMGTVTVAPGADRPGVPTIPAVKMFVQRLSGILGTSLTIGTGSNHTEMTTDGNVSDHWTGHAADVPLSGAALTKAGQTALIMAGMPSAQALQQRGGLFNLNVGGHRVQIIFNSMQGGNHFNHLHIGIH